MELLQDVRLDIATMMDVTNVRVSTEDHTLARKKHVSTTQSCATSDEPETFVYQFKFFEINDQEFCLIKRFLFEKPSAS